MPITIRRHRIVAWPPLMGLGLICLGMDHPAHAADCQLQRGYLGGEGILSRSSQAAWNFPRPAFRANSATILYSALSAGCQLGEKVSMKLDVSGEYTFQNHQPGTLEDKQRQGSVFVSNAALSWSLKNNLFLDVGALQKSKGFLFAASPLNLFKNYFGGQRSIHNHALADRWRNFYDEGAIGANVSWFRDQGTLDAAIFPRLVRNKHRRFSASDWDTLERTNASDRYLISYTSTGLTQLNSAVSLLLGDEKALSFGLSRNLNDRWILSVESALAYGQSWKHLSDRNARAIQRGEYVEEPFRQRKYGLNADVGVGLRYTSSSQTEYGIEYYGQSQGYSRRQRKQLNALLDYINGGYASQFSVPGMGIPPALQTSFRDYSRQFAAEIDATTRKGSLQGKHYLTLYSSSNKNELHRVDWKVSGTVNLVDYSSVVNAHLSTQVTNHLEAYVGSAFMFGNSQTDFGSFGEKGTYYAGIRYLW